MHIQIQHEDGKVETREVVDLDEAQGLADSGLVVLVPNRDGGFRALEASGVAPSPEQKKPEPVKKVAPAKKPVPAKKTAPKKK